MPGDVVCRLAESAAAGSESAIPLNSHLTDFPLIYCRNSVLPVVSQYF